jgi:hypothetical protein
MTGPQDPCARTTCAGELAHLGGAHLDPHHRLYDGPDTSLRALAAVVRGPALELLHAARRDSWNPPAVNVALHRLAAEIHRLNQQIAAVRVDRDHGIRDALARAEDCAEHGAALRHERHQAYWFSILADRSDAERLVWLTGIDAISDARRGRDDQWAVTVRAHIQRVRRQARRARTSAPAPTLADCQRAGSCEHPHTDAHTACHRLSSLTDEQDTAGD